MADLGQNPPRRGERYKTGISFTQTELAMIEEIMKFDDPRTADRSATTGRLIRIVYAQLRQRGLIPASEGIDPREYEGWPERWRIT